MEGKDTLAERMALLGTAQKEYMKQLFSGCPEKTVAAMTLITMPAGHNLIEAGTPCDYVYIILTGRASGIDFQKHGSMYIFMEFAVTDVLGDYEILGDIREYRISIRTATRCEMIVIPAPAYLEWMQQDVNALFMRTRKLMNTMTNQASKARKYLFLSCKDRLLLYLLEQYKGAGCSGEFRLAKTQPEIAERIGFNVRSVQRAILTLEQDGLVHVKAGKLTVSHEQYLQLQHYTELHFIN